jgi:hypothetical protein
MKKRILLVDDEPDNSSAFSIPLYDYEKIIFDYLIASQFDTKNGN